MASPASDKVHECSRQSAVSDLRLTLLQFQRDEYLCDTELVGEDGCVKAHAVVLAATSTVFKAALKPGGKPEERIIVLPGIELYLIEIAVRYAYTGEIMVPKQYMTTDCLSLVINVLTELGFELSSVITRIERVNDVIVCEHHRNQDSNNSTDAARIAERTVKTEEHDASFRFADDESGKLTSADVKNRDSFSGNDVLQSTISSSDHVDYCMKLLGNKTRTDAQDAGAKEVKSTPDLPPRKLNSAKPTKSQPNAEICSSEDRKLIPGVDDGTVVPSKSLCDICGQVFDDCKLYRAHRMKYHRRRNKDMPVQCTQCGLSFANRPNLRRHMYQHTGERPHLCQHCGEGFIQRKSLLDHVTSRHPEKLDPNAAQFVCRKCGEKLHNSYSYRRHVKLECAYRPAGGVSAPAVRRTRANDEAKPHACEHCGRRFALKASLIIHSRLHTDEWTFHIGRRRYGVAKTENICKTCGKRFNYRATLVAHERVHTGEKPFKCTFCGLAVVTASKLHAHLLRHTGETPHICGTCGKGFRLRANLQSHERTHTGEKPFTCPQCGRQLAHAAQLTDHMRIHTGEKPYKCKVCGKQMRQRAHLATHMRTHTGERPYKCLFCEKSYKQIADLRCHYRRMHQFELPKNADRRPFSDENIKALTTTDDSQTQQDVQ